MDQLVNALAALITFVTSVIHGDPLVPQIRSWDGTTLTMDFNGFRYQATCKSSTGSAGASATVTYPKCELPPICERDHSYGCAFWNDGRTLTLQRREAQAARGAVAMWREEIFAITSAKAIGWGLFPDPPRASTPPAPAGARTR